MKKTEQKSPSSRFVLLSDKTIPNKWLRTDKSSFFLKKSPDQNLTDKLPKLPELPKLEEKWPSPHIILKKYRSQTENKLLSDKMIPNEWPSSRFRLKKYRSQTENKLLSDEMIPNEWPSSRFVLLGDEMIPNEWLKTDKTSSSLKKSPDQNLTDKLDKLLELPKLEEKWLELPKLEEKWLELPKLEEKWPSPHIILKKYRSQTENKLLSDNKLDQSKDTALLTSNIVLQKNKYHSLDLKKTSLEKKKEMVSVNDIGLARQFLSATKEWSSSIYSYSRNEMRSIWGLDHSVSKLIQTYFTSIPDSFFSSNKIKRSAVKKWRFKTNKVYLSKSEFKHTSSKVTITLYLFAERNLNLTYIYKYLDKENFLFSMVKDKGLLQFYNFIRYYPDLAETTTFIKKTQKNFYQYLKLENKYQNLRNFLENKISKCYRKKVVINIIRLKYLYLNNQMLAEYITLKLIKKKRNLFKAKRKIFGKIKFPYVNKYDVNKITLARKRIIMKSFRNQLPAIRGKYIWFDWKINKYFRPKVKDDLSVINDTYKDFLEYINYKFPIGIRLQIAGRLTRRNVAARSLKKFTYIGSIKNIDASFRNLSVSNLRSCFRPNIEYNKINSLARTGAFTVRSWLSNY